MDFEKLLLVAKKNEVNKKEPIKCLTTKFKPPTKQQRDKEKVLSEGVQRFLARKEQEEKEKREEAERRKQQLLALRAQDPKANKRVQTMLKRTKSANKSVMEDAVDNNNTADTLSGPAQPDEDDYGFVSETSSALYNKLIQKMYSMPTDDPKFAPSKKPNSSNLMGTKERVKMALLKQEEEEKLPHKRSRKSKDKSGNGEDDGAELNYGAPDRDVSNHSSGSEKDKSEKPRPKKPMPPPVDFHELLRIAEQKQREPVSVEPKIKKPQEPEVLMTKKQKLEYEKLQEWKKRRELREQELNSEDKPREEAKTFKRIPKIGQSDSKSSSVTSQKSVPKVEQKSNSVKTADRTPVKINKDVLDKPKPKSVTDRKPSEVISDKALRLQREKEEAYRKLKEIEEEEKVLRLKREKEEALRKLKEIEEYEEAIRKEKFKDKSQKLAQKNPMDSVKRNGELNRPKEEAARKLTEKNNRPPIKDGNSSSDKSHKSNGLNFKNSVESIKPNSGKLDVNKQKMGSREFPPKDVIKSREFLPKDVVRSREFPPKDVVRSREFPPKDVAKSRDFPPKDVIRNRQFPPGDVRRKQQPPLKRRRIESDDEYDSEMDDFIDDDEHGSEQIDISKEISQIFGYNKNKYRGYDDDDECMESNFHQIAKEEFHSAKIGLLEDLKDIQREKALKAKAKAKR